MIRKTFLTLLVAIVALAVSAQSEPLSEVDITAKIRTYVLKAPRANAEFIRAFAASATQAAYGRDASGDWLRILDGWVLAEVFRAGGDVAELPDATHSVSVTVSSAAQLYDGPSAKWFAAMGEMTAASKAVAVGRNESGSWLRLPQGWIEVAHIEAAGDIRPLPVAPSSVIITAKARTFILAEPDLSAEFVDVFEAGEEALAIRQAGDWLQISQGWVSAEAVEVSGEIMPLPIRPAKIKSTLIGNAFINIKSRPANNAESVGTARRGDEVFAIGRNKHGSWLLIEDGWIPRRFVRVGGDIMTLPVMEGNAVSPSSSGSTRRAVPTSTPTPSTGLDARAIRSLVARHTDDVRILDIKTASNATTIGYDLKPWPFVPNEQIANEVAFKIICAIRVGQNIPNTLKFIGQSHFKSDVGRKFTSPSVEIHISANNANRIVCRGNNASDINWRSVSSVYKSYPIPRGASVDYD